MCREGGGGEYILIVMMITILKMIILKISNLEKMENNKSFLDLSSNFR